MIFWIFKNLKRSRGVKNCAEIVRAPTLGRNQPFAQYFTRKLPRLVSGCGKVKSGGISLVSLKSKLRITGLNICWVVSMLRIAIWPKAILGWMNRFGGTGVAEWWEHSPPTNVARVRFPDSASSIWRVSLCREAYLIISSCNYALNCIINLILILIPGHLLFQPRCWFPNGTEVW